MAANETEALVLDTRKPQEFAKGHIPRSIFIGLDGSFAPWVGALIKDVSQPILLVTAEGREEEAVTRLARVGFDHTIGYLQGGFEAWQKADKEVDTLLSLAPETLEPKYETIKDLIFDVRKESEYEAEHIENAKNVPLSFLSENMQSFPKHDTFYVHCAGGYRSVIAASILKSRGFHNVVDVKGGFKKIRKSQLPTTAFVCPSTLK